MTDELKKLMEAQGWTEHSVLLMALSFISARGLDTDFNAHLKEAADIENNDMDADDEDDEDDGLMPWEYDAKEAIDAAVASAKFSTKSKTVTIDYDDHHDVCHSYEELNASLRDIGESAWQEQVPFDGGEAVFEYNDTYEHDAIVSIEDKLEKMGWTK